MRISKAVFAPLLVLILGLCAHAQTTTEQVGRPWRGEPGIVETVAEIMERESHTPPPTAFTIRDHDEIEREPSTPPIDPNLEFNATRPALRSGFGKMYITAGTSWTGSDLAASGSVPPDSMGGVSPTQVMVCTNSRIRIYSKSGVLGGLNASTNTFFNSVRNGVGTSDPRVWFDRLSNRWFVIMITVSFPNRVLLAVSNSATVTATSSFTFYQFQQDLISPVGLDSGLLMDYPSLGVDANAVYTGGNMFNSGSSFFGASCFVIRKSSVLSGGPIVVSAFRQVCTASGAGPVAPQGVHNDDPASTFGYFIGSDNVSFSTLVIRRITDPGGTPSISANIPVAVATTGFPQNYAPQLSTTIDTLDDRLFSAQMRLNRNTGVRSLWVAHNIEVNSAGSFSATGNRNGSRWYQLGSLSTTPTVLQTGTVFDNAASNFRSYTIPSISMSGQGHAMIGFTAGGAALPASVGGSFRLASDPNGTMESATVLVTSSFGYNVETAPQRWGDYSMTVVDPADDMTFWTFQEFVASTNNWGVRAQQIRAPGPATITSLVPNTLAQGATANVVVTGTSSAGTGYFDPGPEYPNRLAAAISGSGVTVNSVTYTSPTSITLNVTVSGAATASARDLTITNPDGQFVTGAGVFTVTSSANPVPVISSISPSSAIAGSAGFSLTVSGSNFISGSIVRWNGADRATTFVNSGSVTAAISAADIASAGSASVTVFNPAPGGGTSNSATFNINNPVPTISSITPNPVTAGGSAFTLDVSGTNFVSGSVVLFNGSARSTTFVSSSLVKAAISAADIATAGTALISVQTAAPGGGTTGTLTLNINNPAPTLSSLSPSSSTAGEAAFTLTVNGGNFVSGSTVLWNGSPRTTTFVNSGQLTASISAADIGTAGTASITVNTPGPGGGTSGALTFTINNPSPTLSSISPDNVLVGSGAFTLTVTGTQFVNGSVVRINGVNRVTTFVNSTTLTAQITAGDVIAAGTASIDVFTPTPGGGTSSTQTLTINNPAPTSISLSPSSALVDSGAFTLTVSGGPFVSSSVVNWNGSPRATTYVDANTLQASIPATDVNATGTGSVTVVTPGPGGGTSPAATFTINNPAPVVTSVNPAVIATLSPDTVVEILGTGFVASSQARVDGAPRTTTFVSSTKLEITLTAAELSSVATYLVDVTTAGPGGGTSSALTVEVKKRTLNGNVDLQAFANMSGQQVEIEIRPVGSLSIVTSFFATLDALGNYSASIDLAPGNYDVATKGSHWLRKVSGNVAFNALTVTAPNVSLINGDCNGDNVIDLFDYLILSSAYETALGDPGFLPAADLNGDDAVDFFDYLILSQEYEAQGDD
ncbi:MAG: hypothetical protein JNM85_00175 [Chthonomonas sp.]|nr:hypothetical protein [Chthonomonas sp.]